MAPLQCGFRISGAITNNNNFLPSANDAFEHAVIFHGMFFFIWDFG